MQSAAKRRTLVRRVVRLYRVGNISSVEIARRLGFHPASIARILRAEGVTRPNGWFARPRADIVGRDAEIARLYTKDNLTAEQIASRIGLTPSGVLIALKRRGVPRRKTGSWSPPRPKRFYEMRAYAERVAPLVGTGPGTSVASFARAAGYPVLTLRAHMRALGVKAPVGGSTPRFSVAQVRLIKRQLASGRLSMYEVAKAHNARHGTIWAIASGRSWRNIPWPGGTTTPPPIRGLGTRTRRKARPTSRAAATRRRAPSGRVPRRRSATR